MSRMIVVGSGATGVHLAQTLLDLGHSVTMLDVGHGKPKPVLPDADFDALKSLLDDPVEYFLGASAQAAVFPSRQQKYYSFPPSKEYVFRSPESFRVSTSNFEPVLSFAGGGLAEAWTGGSYALNDAELADFPFDSAALAPHYAEVIERIGVTAARDDLTRFSGWLDGYSTPLEMDAHSAHLLDSYGRQRERLNQRLRFFLGRSRVAVLSRDLGDRSACGYLGRCLWGCPRESIYAPSSTLRSLRRHERFEYVSDVLVTHFSFRDGAITEIHARGADGTSLQFTADAYALAAGALCSSKIFLDSLFAATGEVCELGGLMDNRQFMMPFLSTQLLGRPVDNHRYQLHQLALGLERPRTEEFVHGQITTLKAVSVHPIAQSLPLDLRSALSVFRMSHAALGAANVWLCDRRDPSNVVTIRPRDGGQATDLVIRRGRETNDGELTHAIDVTGRGLKSLGCLLPPGMTRILSPGASIHYAGTLPMSRQPARNTCDADCRSHDFHNLYFADGATFPFLPAKNLTFTLMANAIRVGRALGRQFHN